MAGIATNWSCQWEAKQLTYSCKFRLRWCPVGTAPWALTQTQGSGMYRGGNYFCIEVVLSFFCGKAYTAMELPMFALWVTHDIAVFKGKLTNVPITMNHKGDGWDPSFGKDSLTGWTQIGWVLRSWRTDITCRHQDYLQKRTFITKEGRLRRHNSPQNYVSFVLVFRP